VCTIAEVGGKMKIHRIVIAGFLSVSVVFLSDLLGAEETPEPVIKNQKLAIEVKIRNNTKSVKTRQIRTTVQQKLVAAKQVNITRESDFEKPGEPQRPLDLSIPYADVDKSDRTTELNTETSIQYVNIFAGENSKKTRPVQIDGKLLMSPEPEIEKQKSADGASIVINLKP
jgi:hypothetical protein